MLNSNCRCVHRTEAHNDIACAVVQLRHGRISSDRLHRVCVGAGASQSPSAQCNRRWASPVRPSRSDIRGPRPCSQNNRWWWWRLRHNASQSRGERHDGASRRIDTLWVRMFRGCRGGRRNQSPQSTTGIGRREPLVSVRFVAMFCCATGLPGSNNVHGLTGGGNAYHDHDRWFRKAISMFAIHSQTPLKALQ